MQKPIRLYWGENYSEKPPEVIAAIKKAEENSRNAINLYPGSLYSDVTQLISQQLFVPQSQIILTHGVEGGVHLLADTFLGPDKIGGMFTPSFFVYGYYIKRSKNFVMYPCRYDKKIALEDFLQKIENCDIFYHASPNTSTGNYLLDFDEMEYILKKYTGLFVVDECYLGLGDISVLPLLEKYKNLVVMRGLSKVMGMPALRLAYTIANPDIIQKLRYNLNDVEFDPINTYSLNIFKETFPLENLMAKTTKEFFDQFLSFMQQQLPNDSFIKTVTTYQLMEMRNYTKPTYEVMNYLSENGYEMSENKLADNASIDFPEFLEIGVPPKEYWEDFSKTLQSALE